MSTRCTVHFQEDNEDAAIIYRHSDGYPSSMLPDLQAFFTAVQEQTRDTRFSDACYLASKFVVYLSQQFTRHYTGNGEWVQGKPLDFISVGVVLADPSDIEYRYIIDCSKHTAEGFPLVECVEAEVAL